MPYFRSKGAKWVRRDEGKEFLVWWRWRESRRRSLGRAGALVRPRPQPLGMVDGGRPQSVREDFHSGRGVDVRERILKLPGSARGAMTRPSREEGVLWVLGIVSARHRRAAWRLIEGLTRAAPFARLAAQSMKHERRPTLLLGITQGDSSAFTSRSGIVLTATNHQPKRHDETHTILHKTEGRAQFVLC